ncbi:MAG: molybdopterin molybdotransferase [Thermoanaerobaculia bacterium]|jgi:molybdopterin molybdotransferase|nr:molybdopterin molybdotransferase [Thermoanaerobaculia bacterium]
MTTFQAPREGESMIAVEEAQARVLAEVNMLDLEEVAFTEAHGRVLREDIHAAYDVPQKDNTAMDGYAVRAEDIAGANADAPMSLNVIEDLPAGTVAVQRVEKGTAIRIMTGALMPDGADTVAHVEITDAGDDVVRVFSSLKRGTNIRKRGEDMQRGDVVLRDGTPLHAAEIGVLASVQKASVCVGRRPSVAILSTGDEIIDVSDAVTPGKVVNSNSYSLAALTREAGAIPRMIGIVRDTRDATISAIESALESDFVISSGGVSVGAYDFVKDALDALGAETKFWQVAMKPGKPVVLSRLRGRLYFGLPGNPVSCMVSFLLFIAPAIRKAMGQTENLLPPIVQTRVMTSLKSRGDRRNYMRVRVFARGGELVSQPMTSQGSGVSTSMIQANGLVIVETGVTAVEAGSLISTVLVGPVQGSAGVSPAAIRASRPDGSTSPTNES